MLDLPCPLRLRRVRLFGTSPASLRDAGEEEQIAEKAQQRCASS